MDILHYVQSNYVSHPCKQQTPLGKSDSSENSDMEITVVDGMD